LDKSIFATHLLEHKPNLDGQARVQAGRTHIALKFCGFCS